MLTHLNILFEPLRWLSLPVGFRLQSKSLDEALISSWQSKNHTHIMFGEENGQPSFFGKFFDEAHRNIGFLGDIPQVGSSRHNSSGSVPRVMASSNRFLSPWEIESPNMFA